MREWTAELASWVFLTLASGVVCWRCGLAASYAPFWALWTPFAVMSAAGALLAVAGVSSVVSVVREAL